MGELMDLIMMDEVFAEAYPILSKMNTIEGFMSIMLTALDQFIVDNNIPLEKSIAFLELAPKLHKIANEQLGGMAKGK